MSEAYINKMPSGIRVEKLYDDTFNVQLSGSNRTALMHNARTLPMDADIIIVRGTIKTSSANGGPLLMYTNNQSSTRDFFSLNDSSLLQGIPFSRMWIGGRYGDYWVAPTQGVDTENAFIPLDRGGEIVVTATYNLSPGPRAEGRIQVLAVWFG